jgi:hypothetical protein
MFVDRRIKTAAESWWPPDRQVREAIDGIFRKFRELGSVRQVLLWYREEKLSIPTPSRESGNR